MFYIYCLYTIWLLIMFSLALVNCNIQLFFVRSTWTNRWLISCNFLSKLSCKVHQTTNIVRLCVKKEADECLAAVWEAIAEFSLYFEHAIKNYFENRKSDADANVRKLTLPLTITTTNTTLKSLFWFFSIFPDIFRKENTGFWENAVSKIQ